MADAEKQQELEDKNVANNSSIFSFTTSQKQHVYISVICYYFIIFILTNQLFITNNQLVIILILTNQLFIIIKQLVIN